MGIMNTFKKYIFAILIAVASIGCNEKDDVVTPVGDSTSDVVSAKDTCSVTFSFFEDYTDPETKSSYFSDPNLINQLKSYRIYLYNSLGQLAWSGNTYKARNIPITDYTVVVLANLKEYPDECAVLDDFLSSDMYRVNTTNPGVDGVPMTAVQEVKADEILSGQVSIQLTRQICRVNFRLDKSSLSSTSTFTVKEVFLENIPTYITPFSGRFVPSTSDEITISGDRANTSDLISVNNGDNITLYTYENVQGRLLPGNTDPLKRTPDNIGNKCDYCTYLVVRASYSGNYEGANVSTDDLVYKYYLGQDNTDFSIVRNSTCYYILKVTDNGVYQDEWKVNYGKDLPVVTNYLVPDQSEYSVNCGATINVVVNHKKYVDDTEVINENVSSLARWKVADENVAMLNGTGVVKGLSQGSTTVSVEYNGLTCNIPISVTDVITYKYRLELRGDDAVNVGSKTSKYKVYYARDTYTNGIKTVTGDFQEWTDAVSWSIGTTSIATISDGVITGIRSGYVNLSATVNYNDGNSIQTASVNKTVAVKDSKTIEYVFEIIGNDRGINVGETTYGYYLKMTTKRYTNGILESEGSAEYPNEISWSINTSIATISTEPSLPTGSTRVRVTGVSGGTAVLKATVTYESQQYEASISIPVKDIITYKYRGDISGPKTLKYKESATYKLMYAVDTYTNGVLTNEGEFNEVEAFGKISWYVSGSNIINDGVLVASSSTTGVQNISASCQIKVGDDLVDISASKEITITDVITFKKVFRILGDSTVKVGEYTSMYKIFAFLEIYKNDLYQSSEMQEQYFGTANWSFYIDSYADYATLSNNKIFGKKAGTVTLYVTLTYEGQTYEAYKSVEVISTETYQYRFYVSGASSVLVGQSTSAYVVTYAKDTYIDGVLSSSGAIQNWTGSVTWSIGSSSVASISSSGVVTGKQKGTTSVTATISHESGTYTPSCNLTVQDDITYQYRYRVVAPNEIYVHDECNPYVQYAKDTYTNGVLSSSGNWENYTGAVTWTIMEGSSFIAVPSDFKLLGKAAGSVTYRAKFTNNGQTESITKSLTVKDKITYQYRTGLIIQDSQILTGQTTICKVVYYKDTYTNGTLTTQGSATNFTGAVTWSITDSTPHATIAGGEIRGVSPGTVNVKAVFTFDGQSLTATGSLTVIANNSSVTPGTGWDDGGSEEYN